MVPHPIYEYLEESAIVETGKQTSAGVETLAKTET
jgi:hypothetical protein